MAIRLQEEENFSLEMTPMIDVVFLLIIFFLVATTFQQVEKEMDVSVPQSETGVAGTSGPEPVIVNVMGGDDGLRVIVNGQSISLQELTSLLQRTLQEEPATKATLRGDGVLQFEDVITVCDAVRKAKVPLSLALREKRGQAGTPR